MNRFAPATAVLLTLLGVGVQYALPAARVENLWHRMALAYVVLIPLTLVLCRPSPSTSLRAGWMGLFAWRGKHVGGPSTLLRAAAVATALMLALTFAVVYGIRAWSPQLSAEIDRMMAWKALVPPEQMWPLLVWIIVGEEIVWRGGVTVGFAKFGLWPAVLLGAVAFMLFHLAFGPPLLLAGGVWSWLVLRFKSLWPPLVSHLLWDVTVMPAL